MRARFDSTLQLLSIGNDSQAVLLQVAGEHEEIAQISSGSLSTVRRWFARGKNYRCPMPTDLRHLALMNFLLEHFEDIPKELLQKMCFPDKSE